MKRSVVLSICCIFTLSPDIRAQDGFIDDFLLGASINYNTLHVVSNIDWPVPATKNSYDFGYQFYTYVKKIFSQNVSIQTGLEFYVLNDKIADNQKIKLTENSSEYYLINAENDLRTVYLNLPVRIQCYPFIGEPIYLIGGIKYMYKIDYKNSVINMDLYSDENGFIEKYSSLENDVPESSNPYIFAVAAGFGFNLSKKILPITFELKGEHSITPYLVYGELESLWIRGLSFSISFRL